MSAVMVSHGLREWTHVQDAFRRQRLYLRLPHRDDTNGITYRLKDFQSVIRFLVRTAWMVFDNGGHIPAPKAMLGETGFERYSAEHFVFHLSLV